MDRTRAHTGIGPFNTCQFIREAERGVAKACPAAVGVLVFLVAIGLAGEGSHEIWTPHSSLDAPVDSRAANRWSPAPLAPVGTDGVNRTPPARYSPAMAYDSESARTVLFGGQGNSGFLDDTWAYDFNANMWTNMTPAITPPSRYKHAMAYDSKSDRVILFGGNSYGNAVFNDTWAYDFNTNTWTDMTPTARPLGRSDHAMAYDSASDRVILFGGGFYDTWAYDFNTNTWTDMTQTSGPPGRDGPAMAYDSATDRVILFGGSVRSRGDCNETWAYDFNANTWTDLATTPPARYGHAIAYDSRSDRVILFGGLIGPYDVRNDTWAYDFNTNTWTDMAPLVGPPVRDFHAMAYDSRSDRVILFGGQGSSGVVNDTWAYDFKSNAWTNLAPASSPLGRDADAMAYDSAADRVILFGGQGSSGVVNDTWAYDHGTNTWTNMASAPAPSGRAYHGMVYDSQSDRAILFGGWASNTGSPLEDTWTYDLNANGWTNVDAPVPLSAPRALGALSGNAQVRLDWQAPASDGGSSLTGYNIYRGFASGTPVLLSSVGNVLTYADNAVTNGVTYYYQAGALNLAGEGPRSNEVSAMPKAAPDSTPPTATIGSLPNNTVVNSTTITLTGTASDNVAIEKVEVSADGTTWILATGTTSWSATLTLREGQNTIFVRTTDTSGNVSITTFTVKVELAPLTPQGTPSLAVDRVAGGAAVTAAIVVGVYVSSSVASGSSGVSAASGGMKIGRAHV